MTNLKSQSGRSMVEMLGVLAIIGVLSIGGIAGYTMAMNRYKANEILAAAAQVAVIGQTANMGDGADQTAANALGRTPDGVDAITYTASTGAILLDGVDTAGIGSAINSIVGGTPCGETPTDGGDCTLYMTNSRLSAAS